MMIFNLILIAVFFTFVIDITGGMSGLWNMLGRLVFKTKEEHSVPKPFGCSTCMSFWTSLFYIIITNQFSILNLTLCVVFATFIPQITLLIYNLIQKLFNFIYERIN